MELFPRCVAFRRSALFADGRNLLLFDEKQISRFARDDTFCGNCPHDCSQGQSFISLEIAEAAGIPPTPFFRKCEF